jgi:hypothetical protein
LHEGPGSNACTLPRVEEVPERLLKWLNLLGFGIVKKEVLDDLSEGVSTPEAIDGSLGVPDLLAGQRGVDGVDGSVLVRDLDPEDGKFALGLRECFEALPAACAVREVSLDPVVFYSPAAFSRLDFADVQLVGGGLDLLDAGLLRGLFLGGHRQ